MSETTARIITSIYQSLSEYFGPLDWWPAETPFEVVIGAILTQNTAWTNVEKAIHNLKQAGALTPRGIAALQLAQLEQLIRPSGFFRQKAIRLQGFARHLIDDWNGDLDQMCGGPLDEARARLLVVPGIGPETADSILLYAAGRPSFVVDAYTRRIFERVGLLQGNESYDQIRALFMGNLPADADLFNEYHAQVVGLAKTCCLKREPKCGGCPLATSCRYATGP